MLISNIFVHLLHLLSILGIPQLGFGSQPTHIKAVPKLGQPRSGKGAGSPLQTKIRVRKPWKPWKPWKRRGKWPGHWHGLDYLKTHQDVLRMDMNGYEWIYDDNIYI